MRKLPTGISNYERLIEENYIYVDKTMYIEKLENLSNTAIMFLRPRKFGKTLFTSTLENYYDIQKIDSFEELFAEMQRLSDGASITKYKCEDMDDPEDATFKYELTDESGYLIMTYYT